jgi:GIY-YIG catalytic domain
VLSMTVWENGSERRAGVAMKAYFVYILAGKFRSLYTGVTNNLERRVLEHKRKLIPGFTSKYNINRLVYFERAATSAPQSKERSRSRDGPGQRASSSLRVFPSLLFHASSPFADPPCTTAAAALGLLNSESRMNFK